MKRNALAKWLLLTLIIFGGILLLINSRALSQQTPAPSDSPISFRYRAGLAGNYVGYAGPSTSPTYPDLSQVTLLSSDIITGTALSNKCTLSPDGNFITIDYQIRVDSKFKGKITVGDTIKVSLPGGKIGFVQPDGNITYAEIRTAWFKKMENGKQYYLFLTGHGPLNTKYGFPPFETTGGPQGAFEIVNGVVKSNSGRLKDPIWQYHNMALTAFNNLVRDLVTTQETGPVPSPTPPPTIVP